MQYPTRSGLPSVHIEAVLKLRMENGKYPEMQRPCDHRWNAAAAGDVVREKEKPECLSIKSD